jgi:hypothetical protein
MNVLWEMGRLPDLTMLLPPNVRYIVPLPSREDRGEQSVD